MITANMVKSNSITPDSALDEDTAALHVSDPDSGKHVRLAAEMVSRCGMLLAELEEFQSYLKKQRKDNIVGVKGFKYDIENELKRLKAVRNLSSLFLRTEYDVKYPTLSRLGTLQGANAPATLVANVSDPIAETVP